MDENFKETLVYLTLSISNRSLLAPRFCEVIRREGKGEAGAVCSRPLDGEEPCLAPAAPNSAPIAQSPGIFFGRFGCPRHQRRRRAGRVFPTARDPTAERSLSLKIFTPFVEITGARSAISPPHPALAAPQASLPALSLRQNHKVHFSFSFFDALHLIVIKLGATLLFSGGR